ncbi:MAG TPA: hypothetical protein VG028_09055 [Terriglobia bacterium]|nr:hypothetical protein [Terriglobia bacterium]
MPGSTRSKCVTTRPFLPGRYFLITVRRLSRRRKLIEPDLILLARAFNRARARHNFYLTACVFLPHPWPAICEPVCPVTIPLAMKSVQPSSMTAIHRRPGAEGEFWPLVATVNPSFD